MPKIFASEHQSLIGYWWIPSSPSDHLPGTLEIAPDRFIRLSLLGTFTDARGHDLALPIQIHRIFGIVDGQIITLDGCTIHFGGFSSPGFFKSIAFVEGVFIGEHFTEDCFSEVAFETDALGEWTRICGFEINEADVESRRTSLDYQQPAALHFDLDGCSSLELRFGTRGFPVFPGPRTSVNLTLVQYFAVSFHEPQPIQAVREYIYRLWQFIHFSVNQKTQITNIKLRLPVISEERQSTTRQISYISSGSAISDDGFDSLKVLVPFKYIHQDRGVFRRWLSLAEDIDAAFDLHFSIERQDSSYVEQEFIARTTSLEVAHRRTTEICLKEKEAHTIRLGELYEYLKDSPHLPWLRSKLAFSHEPTLEQRLLEIRSIVAPFFSSDGLFSDRFIKQVVKTRNYLTHYSKGDPKKRLDDNDLPAASFRLRALFVVYVLFHLDLSSESIRDLVNSPTGLEYQLKTMAEN